MTRGNVVALRKKSKFMREIQKNPLIARTGIETLGAATEIAKLVWRATACGAVDSEDVETNAYESGAALIMQVVCATLDAAGLQIADEFDALDRTRQVTERMVQQ